MTDNFHNNASSLREQYIEYGFLGELCREMWRRNLSMDVLRSHTDRSGYDILLEANGTERHVQLKSSFDGAKTSRQKVNVRLSERPSGCIVWIRFDPHNLRLTEYLWFGGEPGKPLPALGDTIGKHSKGDQHGYKAHRADIRVLNKGQFEAISSMSELANRLFLTKTT
ncbi:hypothetical protein Q5Y75_24755 [Ruegeria sp. 2205SS24-7]|uniref:hypothetical protein n=1 Tax=Ruegeria discodermiae TaxID=3064389 RepID=UPI0027423F6F|nr:hypothetical protein [Ruegeria sp. 2205SS24-7]MDP5220401.1 hypothetical protein [Ruegeria sp. 2205SS24-7]